MTNLLRELRRRKVFTVAAAYAVVAWLLLQVAATVFPIFEAPEWVLKVVTVLLAIGFPLALVLAWAYDLTGKGIVRTGPADSSHQGKPQSPEGGAVQTPVAPPPTVDLPSGPSIAVLPFSNLGGDSDQDHFADALTGDIVSGLTRSSHLFVVSTGAAAGSGGDLANAAEEARKLGVKYLLQGSVRRSGDTLRVSARLLEAGNGVQIWSQDYDRRLDAESLFALQDDIREQIVATLSDLHGVIYSTQSKRNVHRPTDSLNAWECLSVALAYDKHINPQFHLRARESLERAVELDPNFDEAWAHLSWIYTDEHIYGFNTLPDSMERALAAARKGVELNPDNYHNHWLLSRVYYFLGDRDWFFGEANKALELNSSDGTTLGLIGLYTAWAGDWERGMDMLSKARLLNPRHPDYYFSGFGIAAFARGEYVEALRQFLKGNLPEYIPHLAFQAATLSKLGRGEEAARAVADLKHLGRGLTVDDVAEVLNKVLPFQPELVEVVLACLRKAGG